MRLAIAVSVILLIAPILAAASSTSHELPEKHSIPSGIPVYEGRVGGEDIASAVPITVPYPMGFYDTGNTCGFLDDYDEACPYTGSTSPDVVYSLTLTSWLCIEIDLCASSYDTKVYVYEDEWTPGNPLACNDDADCQEPYRSSLGPLLLDGGHTYYVVIDGYGGDCGDYELLISEWEGCTPCAPCPAGGIDEGEGPCFDGYVDEFNGGCNSEPPVFSVVEPSPDQITICGIGGNYDDNSLRDTDWYLLDLACEETTITLDVVAEFGPVVGFVDMSPGCGNITGFYSYVTGTQCYSTYITETLPAGEWAVFVSTADWLDWPCDAEYVLTIDGYEQCVPVERASWGTVKALYR